MPDEEKRARGERVKALRERLEMSQEGVAARSRGELQRTYVVRIEGGGYAITSTQQVNGLAYAFDLAPADLELYLDAAIDLEEALRRRRVGPTSTPQRDEAARLALNEYGVSQLDIDRIISEHPDAEDAGATWLHWFAGAATEKRYTAQRTKQLRAEMQRRTRTPKPPSVAAPADAHAAKPVRRRKTAH
jgi:transcriptional regulator with XRE-family HTH domain